jgi:hypothetical protein
MRKFAQNAKIRPKCENSPEMRKFAQSGRPVPSTVFLLFAHHEYDLFAEPTAYLRFKWFWNGFFQPNLQPPFCLSQQRQSTYLL